MWSCAILFATLAICNLYIKLLWCMQVEIINELPEDKTITVYRCGPLVDLCRGPHIPNTSFVKAFACLKVMFVLCYWFASDATVAFAVITFPLYSIILGISFILEREIWSGEPTESLWYIISRFKTSQGNGVYFINLVPSIVSFIWLDNACCIHAMNLHF